ncbi:SCO2400 family protein [Streptomyces sp. NPDC002073]
MDYCHACRRHLNGALACAGCGTPAEYLTAGPAPGAAELPAVELAAPPPVFADYSGAGRADARRRRTAGHRRRRRGALTVGLGLLFAAGGSLAVAALTVEGDRSDRAATVVQQEEVGSRQPQAPETFGAPTSLPAGPGTDTPTPTGTAGADEPDPSASSDDGPGVPVAGRSSAGGDPGGPGAAATGQAEDGQQSGDTGGSEGSGESDDADDADGRGGSEESTGPDSDGDEPGGRPSPSRSAAAPGTSPPASPQPDPDPTETCEWFLWWCV